MNKLDPTAENGRLFADLTNRLHIAETALAQIDAIISKATARASHMSLNSFRALTPAARMEFIKSGGKLTD